MQFVMSKQRYDEITKGPVFFSETRYRVQVMSTLLLQLTVTVPCYFSTAQKMDDWKLRSRSFVKLYREDTNVYVSLLVLISDR